MTHSNLMQEIEEDLQRQKLEALWKRYGGYIVGFVLAVILGTALTVSWKNYRHGAETKATAELLNVLSDKESAATKQITALEDFAKSNKEENESSLALLQAAAIAAKAGDTAKAVALYDALSANKNADKQYRELADLMSVKTQMDDGDPAKLMERLQPLMKADSTWHYSALEFGAHLALRSGDAAKAKQFFTELADDTSAPQTLALRARDMLRLIKDGQKK